MLATLLTTIPDVILFILKILFILSFFSPSLPEWRHQGQELVVVRPIAP